MLENKLYPTLYNTIQMLELFAKSRTFKPSPLWPLFKAQTFHVCS